METDKRKSRPHSYTSLGRGELDNEDDYLVIDREHSMRGKHDPPYFPTMPTLDSAASPGHHSFSVIGNEEIVQSLPVDGLGAATEAAKELSDEKSRVSISSEKALSLYGRVHDSHFHALMIQQMKSLGLNLHWLEVIRPLITEAVHNVRTNVFPDDLMDINQYVKIKKIPRGIKNNSSLVYGVVCTKNVTHKKMLRSIKNPKILLLKCAFEFQRKENQLSSFDTLQLQEEKYLKNLVVKVSTIKPNLILLQKSVSRLALEMLYELGIVVVLNVKPSVMTRVSRSTNGEILHSLDQLMFGTASIFGTCGHFYIRNYLLPDGNKKTLMYFDHCPPKLGCAITLQGASMKELKKVKKVVQFGLHIAHNSGLETHFLVDEFAWPEDPIDETCATPTDNYASTSSTPEWPLYPSLGYPFDSLSQNELQRKLEALKFVEIDTEDSENSVEITNQTQNEEQKMAASTQKSEEADIESPFEELEITCDETEQSLPPVSDHEAVDKSDDFTNCLSDGVHSTPPPPQVEDELTQATVTVETETIDPPPFLRPLSPTPYAGKITDKVVNRFAEEEFKLAHHSQIISVSPYVTFRTPYLQTPRGRSGNTMKELGY